MVPPRKTSLNYPQAEKNIKYFSLKLNISKKKRLMNNEQYKSFLCINYGLQEKCKKRKRFTYLKVIEGQNGLFIDFLLNIMCFVFVVE